MENTQKTKWLKLVQKSSGGCPNQNTVVLLCMLVTLDLMNTLSFIVKNFSSEGEIIVFERCKISSFERKILF